MAENNDIIRHEEGGIEYFTETTAKATAKSSNKIEFDINKLIDSLTPELQISFQEMLNSGTSLTDSVINLIKISRENPITQKVEKVSGKDEVKTIITAILEYNTIQPENTGCVVPGYSIINKIAEKHLNKSLPATTVDTVLTELNDDITTRLGERQITGLALAKWNAKYHRKDMRTVVDGIIRLLNRSLSPKLGGLSCLSNKTF